MRKSLATGGAGAAGRERPGSPAGAPVLISTARPLASRQLTWDGPMTSRLAAGGASRGVARSAGTDAMAGSSLSAAMVWAPSVREERPGPGKDAGAGVGHGPPVR